MRTVLAGLKVLRDSPRALVPLTIEAIAVAFLVAFDLSSVFPRDGTTAAAAAVFPLDVYFDLKQSLAWAFSWTSFVAAIGLAVVLRGATLAATLWLADGAPGPFVVAWVRGTRLAAIAALALAPSAILHFTGAATRYAPFVWIAGVAGLLPAAFLARRAARLDIGNGEPPGRGVPELATFLGYAYLVAALGVVMSVLGRRGGLGPALVVLCAAPLHGLYLLGWRSHLRRETYPGGGTAAVALSGLAVVGLFGPALYDRYVRDPAPVGRAANRGSLLLLGGADSTFETGALADVDPRDLGFTRGRATLLSYRSQGPYGAEDTRADLDDVATIVSRQIAEAARPAFLLGHSQASLVLDRLLTRGLAAPDRAAVLAPSVPYPPRVEIPPPGEAGTGKVGGDLARAVSVLLDLAGLQPFHVDAPAAPTNVEGMVVERSSTGRLAVWALADSVWLDGDWRRPGEVNVVAVSDHVGTTNNTTAVGAVRDFFVGRVVEGDEASLKGLLVALLRHAFEPWRPG